MWRVKDGQRDFENGIWTAGRTGGFSVRDEHDERGSAEGSWRKDALRFELVDEKCGDGCTGWGHYHGGTAEQQRYYSYGHRLCERWIAEATAGDFHYFWG